MKSLEKELKALANRRRLAILKYLRKEKEASVREIAHEINLSFRSTSKHLGVLAAASIVERDQRSLQVFYSLPPEKSRALTAILSLV